MESKAAAPETASFPLSNSTGSYSSSSHDSPVNNSFKNNGLNDDNGVNKASSGSSDGGFVSGEEELEMEPAEEPVVVETPEKPVSGFTFLDPEQFPPLKRPEPVLKVPSSQDDDEKHGEVSKFVGLKGLVRVVEKGLNAEKNEIGVEESKTFGGENEKVETGPLELGDNKVVETDDVNYTGEGVSVREVVNVDFSGSGEAVVGDVVGGKDSEVNEQEAAVVDDVPLDNGFSKISIEVDEMINGNSESEKHVEVITEPKTKFAEVDSNGKSSDYSCWAGNQTSDASDVGVVKDSGDVTETVMEKTETIVSGNDMGILEKEVELETQKTETIGAGNDMGILEKEVELETDKCIEHIERLAGIATDAFDVVSNNQEGGGDRAGSLVIDSSALNAQTHVSHDLEDEVSGDIPEFAEPRAVSKVEVVPEAEIEEKNHLGGEGENEESLTDGENERTLFGSSEAAKQFLEELERGSAVGSHSGADGSHDHSERIDGQIVTDSDEEVDTDDEGEGRELFDSAALAALLKAATGASSEGGTGTVTSQDGTRLFSVERPAGLGSSLRPVKHSARPTRPNLFTSSSLTTGGDSDNNLSEEDKKKLEKLQQLRVKFLRLVHRLGHSPEESIAAQVLYRVALVAGRQTNQLFSLDAAKRTALQLEEEGKDDLDFSLNILVLGKTGVGKSATINSIFGEEKSPIHAFKPATNSVREITGVVDGIKIRVIDCPGLKSSGSEQGLNRKALSLVKKFMKKCPPDIVLYVDRLDTQTRDLNDMPLLKTITSSLGSSIWRNAVVTLTHGASAPPDGPSGSPLSYEVFVAQRSHVVQQSIGQAVGDLRLMNPSLMNPVSLVENHPSCRKNREGEKVLPNGQTWRPQLLLLCFSMKILSEANSLSKPQDPFDHRKLFGFRSRPPPLPYLLSWLLQSRPHPKLPSDQGGDNVDSDIDLADMSDSDQEDEEDEYDQLPPFKPLRKAQLAKLSKEQKKAYLEEYDYRVKLLQKKQWREELRRMREMKKRGKVALDEFGFGEDGDPENGAPAAVPVPLPDMVLPPSFDGDAPAFRYRFLEPTSQFLARPVLDTHGWDHDCGYDGVNLEHTLAVINRFPAAVAVQLTKDKKEFTIHLDSSVAAKHGENGSSMAGFDIQNVGKQLAYILRGETKFKNFKMNKTAAGMSITFLGQNVATGFKVEDQIALGKRLSLVGSTGTVLSQGDKAYGANLEVRLKEADFPIGQDQSSLGLSLVKWRGDLALGANLQSQFSIGRSSKIAVRAGLNNKMSGQISVRTSSSDQLQIALMGLLPIVMSIYKSVRPGVGENYSLY